MLGRRYARLPLWTWVIAFFASGALVILSVLGRVAISPYEAVGFTFGVWSVWLMVVGSVANWPVGLVTAGAYAVLFYRDRLWGDGSLQIFYIVSGAIGWYWWTRGRRGAPLPPRRAVRGEWIGGLAVGVIGAALMYPWFVHLRNPQPFLDAITTALSLVGQFLLMRRTLENWLLWIVADAIYVPLYISRGFTITALLMALYGAMAIRGYLDWRREIALRERVTLPESGVPSP